MVSINIARHRRSGRERDLGFAGDKTRQPKREIREAAAGDGISALKELRVAVQRANGKPDHLDLAAKRYSVQKRASVVELKPLHDTQQ